MNKGAILVIRGGAMGDFIVTLPVLAALRENFPDTRIEVVGYPGPAGLAVAGGLADGFRPIEARGLASYFARRGEFDADWAAYFAGFHVIFSYLYDPDGFFQTNVTSVTRAQFIQGPHRPDESGTQHITEQLLSPLERLAIFGADPQPRLRLAPPAAAARPPVRELAVHPGSSSERKNWPEARWVELLTDLVRTTDLRFLLLGGEAEGQRLERLGAVIPGDRREIWSHRPLPELAARLVQAQAFLGHDTGPGHLAAALGLPGITLWGATNAPVWRPRSSLFELIHAGADLGTLPTASVKSALERLLSTLPVV